MAPVKGLECVEVEKYNQNFSVLKHNLEVVKKRSSYCLAMGGLFCEKFFFSEKAKHSRICSSFGGNVGATRFHQSPLFFSILFPHLPIDPIVEGSKEIYLFVPE